MFRRQMVLRSKVPAMNSTSRSHLCQISFLEGKSKKETTMQIISIPILQQVLSVANNEKNTSRYELSKGGNNQWHFVNISLKSSDVHDVFTWTNSAGGIWKEFTNFLYLIIWRKKTSVNEWVNALLPNGDCLLTTCISMHNQIGTHFVQSVSTFKWHHGVPLPCGQDKATLYLICRSFLDVDFRRAGRCWDSHLQCGGGLPVL